MSEGVGVLDDPSLDDLGQLVQVERVVSVLVQVLVDDGGDGEVAEKVGGEKLDDRETRLVVAEVDVFLEVLVAGLGEVHEGGQGQEFFFLGVVLLD